MRTLTGLSGEYVTFDQKDQNAISHSNFNWNSLTEKIDDFFELVTLFGRSDISRRVSFD